MTDHLLALIGFSFLLTHEMDAVRCREWEFFPGLNRMSENAGYMVFTALHVPLYALLLYGLSGGEVDRGLIVGLDVFAVVHLLLHYLLRNLPRNRFGSPFSWLLIAGAAVFGAVDLLLML